jgi:ABC-2 type transport system ATP-binding protein
MPDVGGAAPGDRRYMIEVRELTKGYGDTVAVDRLSFRVEPGRVTGFLGPNGAGKSTTMRLLLGLIRPDAGVALVGGRHYAQLRQPLRHVGALLDATAMHPGRTAYHHLLGLARSNGIPAGRVDEVLDAVGLQNVARRRAAGFSLGMAQRLGIAVALLGDPPVLLLDEPVNGLDPEGVVWIRDLMKRLASEGRTVLVSSHLMSEMALTADHLIVVGGGRLLADTPIQAFIAEHGSLEEAFMRLTVDAVRYRAHETSKGYGGRAEQG